MESSSVQQSDDWHLQTACRDRKRVNEHLHSLVLEAAIQALVGVFSLRMRPVLQALLAVPPVCRVL